MKFLELVYAGGPVIDVVFAQQRRDLQREIGDGFTSVDLRSLPLSERGRILRKAAKVPWKFIFIRGVEGVEEAVPFFPGAGLFIDHISYIEPLLPGSLSRWSQRLTRAFCYSSKADEALRTAGLFRITSIDGPHLQGLGTPGEEHRRPVVGVVDLGHGAREALGRIKRVRSLQGWEFDIVTTLKDGEATTLDGPFEVAEACDLLICPMEKEDRGEPHEGAVLALGVGRALCTSSTAAILLMPYTRDKYVQIRKYEIGRYGTAFEVYRAKRGDLDDWPKKAKADGTRLVSEILKRLQ